MTRLPLRASLYAVFALSGFAGLIYESIWTHYLKLFLGHAAYAQTLVLSIFMGGMAIGAWLAGERSKRIRRPLLAYAAIELVLGVLAFAFDPMFRGLQGWVFDHAIPALETPLAVDLLKWTLSAAVILPQSILLGATFPLMSAGVIRIAGDIPGRVLSWLYFTNSAGAAVGVLASGFVLIAAVGLPGTIMAAGLVNFALVLVLWLLLRGGADAGPAPVTAPAVAGPMAGGGVFLAAAFLTGAASFFYEIGWIRMLSLVLGSATHSFELMLSAFIFGLALGSFLLRRRIDGLKEPLRFLGLVQVVMALLALLTLVLYGKAFDAMATVLGTVQQNDRGYALFNVFSHLLCLALMLPVTICAGMTLPLITRLMIAGGHGEASIGRIYAANTLGSITGVLLAVHLVMPLMGLRQVIVVGAAVDFALGLWLLWMARRALPAAGRWALGGAAAIAVAIVVTVRFDASRLASGVFRTGHAQVEGQVLFHRDGKTASVDVYERGDLRYIATNGKVDAALGPSRASTDDFTQILAAALPAMVHPDLRRVAVIGFGSGRSTHALLQSGAVETVDTIEIEPAMVEGARAFGDLVAAAYDDPRSRIHIEDAKTFFARGSARYDAIISEPSNPWVSGVASLFSREFYRQARRHLEDDGVLVQWLQLYEFDLSLVASILKALGSEFGDYAVYLTDANNVLIVAPAGGAVPEARWNTPASRGLEDLLRTVEVRRIEDMQARRVGNRALLEPWLARMSEPPNSDYFPFVDQHAARHRFLKSWATHLDDIRAVAARLEGRSTPDGAVALSAATAGRYEAWVLGAAFAAGRPPADAQWTAASSAALATLRAFPALCDVPAQAAWLLEFQKLSARVLPWLSPEHTAAIVRALRAAPCHGRAPEELRRWIDFFEADGRADWPRVRELGWALLQERDPREDVTQFLIGEVLLADLKMGRAAQARGWLLQLEALELSAPARFLMAHVAQRSERQEQERD